MFLRLEDRILKHTQFQLQRAGLFPVFPRLFQMRLDEVSHGKVGIRVLPVARVGTEQQLVTGSFEVLDMDQEWERVVVDVPVDGIQILFGRLDVILP
ncbi:hypothetical protein [Pontiella desulfatans]|uniref:hypothetical protein n=1 Tax=Pontiella desulfatans TaxID=2750659 RepID=UPI001443D535